MKSNPILEEVWRIKDQLAAEAGYDMDRFFENLRKWEAEHPHPGPVVNSAEELQQLIAEKERQRSLASPMVLNEKPAEGRPKPKFDPKDAALAAVGLSDWLHMGAQNYLPGTLEQNRMNKTQTVEGMWRIYGDDKPGYFGILTFNPENGLELTIKIPQCRDGLSH